MHNRSVRHNKFNLPSMRRLWKVLGSYDAHVQYNECAVRQFNAKWQEHKVAGEDFTTFIKTQSEEVGINLGNFDINAYRQEIYRWYMVHPYGCIDAFVREFKDDLEEFGYNIKLDFPNKSSLEKLISGMREAEITITVKDYKLALDRYYHRCRNLVAHKPDQNEKDKVDKLYKALNKDELLKIYPTLTQALTSSEELTFDDYLLCTANMKNITDTLTTDFYSVIDWSKFKADSQWMKRQNRFSENPERSRKFIKNCISSRYGIVISDEEIDIIQQNLTQSNNG